MVGEAHLAPAQGPPARLYPNGLTDLSSLDGHLWAIAIGKAPHAERPVKRYQ